VCSRQNAGIYPETVCTEPRRKEERCREERNPEAERKTVRERGRQSRSSEQTQQRNNGAGRQAVKTRQKTGRNSRETRECGNVQCTAQAGRLQKRARNQRKSGGVTDQKETHSR